MSPDGIWQAVTAEDQAIGAAAADDAAGAAATTEGEPTAFRAFSANVDALQSTLAAAPDETNAAAAVVLSLPMADGSFQRFHVVEYQMLDAAMAAANPQVKTYLGWGIDDPNATVRLSWTSAGLNGMILTGTDIQYVDALAVENGLYRSYDHKSLAKVGWAEQLIQEDNEFHDKVAAASVDVANIGETLHVYRLAIAASGEFTQFYGGKAAAKEGIVTIVNQLNALYERELSIRFTLVNNDAIVFENPTTDPFTKPVDFAAIGLMLGENQRLLDEVIRPENYDVGHVFSIGGGGLGGWEPCRDGAKAQGSSNVGNPKSPTFVTGMFAHELGHQFHAGHTFNASCSNNRSADSAYEPGSGSTIMSYGGVCEGQNIVDGGDGYFHSFSIQQITQFVTDPNGGAQCGTHTPTANGAPQVNAGPDATIPALTPFKLAGTATDPNGDALTYTWEQFDNGAAWTNGTVLPNTDLGTNPIIRSFPPGPANTRYIPAINNPAAAKGESLPTTNRTLKFRLTARDGKGGVGSDDVNIQVSAAAGPFLVTAPAAGSFWTPNSQQTVTWSVANTNQAPINCANVNIMASSDGGANFVMLKANTPNDGSEQVTAPGSGTNTVIMVACAGAGQIFYAISPQPGVRVCSPIFQDDHEDGAAGWTVGGPNNPPNGNYTRWTLRTNGGFGGSSNYWYVPNGYNQSFTTLDSQQLTATSDNVSLSFVHKYRFLSYNANGVSINQIGKVQINVNNGGWQDLAGYTASQDNYTETQIDLTGKVKNGDNFIVRYLRDNNGNGWMLDDTSGWSLDNVLVCASNPQVPVDPPVVPDTGDRTWTGAASSDWGDAANWNPQAVPTEQNNAVIPAGLARYPSINGTFAVNNMLIAGGANVAMAGGELTVNGNWGQTNNTSVGQPIEVCRNFGAGEGQINEQKLLDPDPVVDTLTVDAGSPIADLDVFLDMSHTWVGDVVAKLRHVETNTELTIFDPSDNNCSGDNFALSLDDEANDGVADACTSNNPAYPGNRYRPNNALSAFDGQLSAGQWTLTLTDIYPTVDTGRLNRWCVHITPVDSGGVFNATGGMVVFAGAQTQLVRAGAGSVFNDVHVGRGGTTQQVRLTNGIDVNGNLVIGGNSVLDAGAAMINLAGNWQQPATASFVPGTSSVIFDGGNQSVSLGAAGTVAAINFNILAVNAGSTVDFGYGWPQVTQQMVNNGTVRQTKDLPAGFSGGFFVSGGYGGLTMSVQGGAPGVTVVSINKQVDGCTAKIGETVQRCYDINPANKTNLNATLTFAYQETEQSGNSCTFMNAYQNDLSGTELPELPVQGRACTGALRSITVNNVNNFNTTAFTLGSDVGGDNKRADDPPVAVDDESNFLVGETEYVVDVLYNDFDPEGLAITLDFVGDAGHGEVVLDRGVVKYKPEAGYVGEDTFTYEISDIGEQTASATVTVRILEQLPDNDIYLPLIQR
ncbi:MAG: M12 family metallo-peptidase [Caldilineaceae bacterium]